MFVAQVVLISGGGEAGQDPKVVVLARRVCARDKEIDIGIDHHVTPADTEGKAGRVLRESMVGRHSRGSGV